MVRLCAVDSLASGQKPLACSTKHADELWISRVLEFVRYLSKYCPEMDSDPWSYLFSYDFFTNSASIALRSTLIRGVTYSATIYSLSQQVLP
jgi:hypothetical protein